MTESFPAPGDREHVDGSVDLRKVLIVALHQQPPSQDSTIRATLEGSIKVYQQRLARRSGDETSFVQVPDEPGLEFYAPVTSLLWGPYDHATFYLADDLESVVHVASSSGATAQEFIFGSPYDFGAQEPRTGRGLVQLLGPEAEQICPFLSVSRIKLPDYLLCLGASALRAAMARHLHRVSAEAGVIPVILRCWSWPELACILLADRPASLIDSIRAIESTTVGDLRRHDPDFAAAFQVALAEHSVGRGIARLWTEGPPGDGQRPVDDPVSPDLLDERHAVVAAKSQVGILEPLWHGLSAGLPGCLKDVGSRAFGVSSAPENGQVLDEGQVRAELDEYCAALRECGHEPADLSIPFIARISVLVKPGHLQTVRWYLDRLVGALPHELSLRTGIDGEGTTILLCVRVPDEPAAFARLLTISHWLRVWEPLQPHIVDVTTLLEQTAASVDQEDDAWPQPPANHLQPSGEAGYGLLHKLPSDEARAFGRYRAKLKGLGRVESRSLHAWMAALGHTVSRPEMYGAMIELYTAASGAYNEVIYHQGSAEARRSHLSEQVRELLRYGRTAYNQRLQFSPVMRGAPPISGQLPYGINQIVGMLDGLAASIVQVAREEPGEGGESPRSTHTVVIFEPDAAIGTRQVLDLTVLRVNLLQALSPVSLCLLFHELGHVVAEQFWSEAASGVERFGGPGRAAWRESRRRTVEMMTSLYCGETVEDAPEVDDGDEGSATGRSDPRVRRKVRWRVKNLLNDVFPHAVWRRLGCGGDFDLFATQFLAGQAMGLRTWSDPDDPRISLYVWAETAIHLMVQKVMEEEGEDVARAVRRLADAEDQRAVLAGLLPTVMKYAETELEDAAQALRTRSGADLSRNLLSLCSWWFSMLAFVSDAERDGPEPFWNHLQALMGQLGQIESRIAEVDRRLRHDDASAYPAIVDRLREGRPVLAGWDVVSEDDRPTDEAFLWVRQILRAITLDFADGHRGGISLHAFRSRALHPDGARPPEPLAEGLYTDHTGGLIVVGRNRRLDYLQVSNAAFESLWELTSRIMAGRIRRFLIRRRDFMRFYPGGLARVQIDGRELRLPVRDSSPVGFSLGPADPLAALRQGDEIKIMRKDARWLKARIAWTTSTAGPVVGAVLEPPDDPEVQESALINPRLQMDPYWLEIVEP